MGSEMCIRDRDKDNKAAQGIKDMESEKADIANINADLIINHKVIFDYLFKSSYMPV